MPTINLTIVDQTVGVTQSGEIGPQGATGPTGTVSAAGDGTAGAPGIAFASDTNTGLFRPGADILGVATGGTERLRIDASGNVGIGVTPTAGNILYTRTSTTGNGFYSDNGSNSGFKVKFASSLTSIGNDFGSPLAFLTTDTERMRIDASGDVGIGTTNPGGWLLNLSSASTDKVRLYNSSGTTNTLDFVDQAWQCQLVGSSGHMLFNTGGTTERMRLTNDGNVGINTTDQFGSGVKVIGLANATTNPSTNPTGGGVLYADAGALKWRGSSGTVTTIANA